jgi:hypothetical protein
MVTIIGIILKLSIGMLSIALRRSVVMPIAAYCLYHPATPHLNVAVDAARTPVEMNLTGVFSKLTIATPSREERSGGELRFSKNRKDRPMRIGTIGAGEVALAVAREALARGHEIVLSSRSWAFVEMGHTDRIERLDDPRPARETGHNLAGTDTAKVGKN